MLNKIFSMKVAGVLLFIFAFAIGTATFIENDYGTQTAKALIYNAKWFELFLLYFLVIIFYNMIRFKSYRKEKLSVFVFHLSFLLIGIGAFVTRYIGYEGTMSIREGERSSHIISSEKFITIKASTSKSQSVIEEPILFSSMTQNSFDKSLDIDNKTLKIELLDYLPSAVKELIPANDGKMAMELMVSSQSESQNLFLLDGDSTDVAGFNLSFDADANSTTKLFKKIYLHKEGNDVFINSTQDITVLDMATKQSQVMGKKVKFEKRKLYTTQDTNIVVKNIYPKAKMQYVSKSLKTTSNAPEMSRFKISVGEKSKEVEVFSYQNALAIPSELEIDGISVAISVGSKKITVPFAITLVDFQLERYPGSASPSSYASEVLLNDPKDGVNNMPYRIYMNHVLDYKNFRLFQTSYDPDEKGTVLSVNHDIGVIPTYAGYALLILGMIWNLFSPKSRFIHLLKKSRQFGTLMAIVMLLPILGYSNDISEDKIKIINQYDDKSVEEFSKIIVQDSQGRMKPIDTMANEILSKVAQSTSLYGANASEIFLGMTLNPKFYQTIEMIKVENSDIAKKIGMVEGAKFASFDDFFDKNSNNYKLQADVESANQKKPAQRNQYDKDIIKVDERFNVMYMSFTGEFLNIYPIPNDTNNKWVNPIQVSEFIKGKDGDMAQVISKNFFNSYENSLKDKNYTQATEASEYIRIYQSKLGYKVMPSELEIYSELLYNKLMIFSRLAPYYIFIGILLLILSFVNILKPSFKIKRIVKIASIAIMLGFTFHIIGLLIRWYIAGHAPWSGAYEAMVFIAGTTILAGVLFAKHSPITLGASALLGGITMGVAHLSFMNPEITNLVPVLKSYWLMIHVATIISGDGFLGLGSILSLLVLILFTLRSDSKPNIDRSIKELSVISEMSLIVGLFLLTIGNFLGGIWANESWGRYWGWDAKETWAAVNILIYAFVLHLRFIPKMNNPFVYNTASLWAYSTVLMTYFGVNYYLSGMHSYAAGDPMPIPMWVPIFVVVLMILNIVAWRKRKML
ncbi:MAG: cytochrome c biogenesis protein CcsA [Epsilonproteobacteria bacterium]|nr:cytochrome c biogenesis protein CcsA [Campylobacterota bacterium]MBD3839053.1 cytochrome c biogenesis protein CcsA [Campylobacterota bacterium]